VAWEIATVEMLGIADVLLPSANSISKSSKKLASVKAIYSLTLRLSTVTVRVVRLMRVLPATNSGYSANKPGARAPAVTEFLRGPLPGKFVCISSL